MRQNFNLLAQKNSYSTAHWWAKIVAFIALINVFLVSFNLSYLPLRPIYLRSYPLIVSVYDPVKAIQPHPEINDYLNTVDTLAAQLNQQGLEGETIETLLGKLRQESLILLNDTSFLTPNQWGILATIKRQIQHHTEILSPQVAFSQFWSREHLSQVRIDKELDFFNNQIRPLLEITYFQSVNQNGQWIDNFWKIDQFFIIFFALEFVRKVIFRSWQNPEQKIGKIILRRWYEGLFFLPFWRWLRIIPLIVKLHQSRLVNIEWLLGQLTYEPAAYLSDRISNFLMVRLINQTKDAVVNGEITRALLEPQPYIKVSSIDKTDAIIDRLLKLTIYNILPKIQPDLEALLRHSLRGTVIQSDFYKGLRTIPGIDAFPTEAIEQLADYLATGSVELITKSYADLKGRELFEDLSQNFKKALQQELEEQMNQADLQALLSELLEEIKLNYVQRSTEHDPESILEEAEQIRHAASLRIAHQKYR